MRNMKCDSSGIFAREMFSTLTLCGVGEKIKLRDACGEQNRVDITCILM